MLVCSMLSIPIMQPQRHSVSPALPRRRLPRSPPPHAKTRGRCIAAADAVVVTAMSIVRGDIDNIRVLEERIEKPIIIFAGNNGDGFEDHSGDEATGILGSLKQAGAKLAGDIPVLVLLHELQQSGREDGTR